MVGKPSDYPRRCSEPRCAALLLAILLACGCGGTVSGPNPATQGATFDDGFTTPAPAPTPGIRNYSFTATVTKVGTRTDIERGTELSGTIRLDPSSLATGGSVLETAEGVRYILTPVQATVIVAGETFGFCRIVEVRVRDDAALLFDQPGEGDSVFIFSFFACGAGQEPDHFFVLHIADYDGQMLDSTDLPHSLTLPANGEHWLVVGAPGDDLLNGGGYFEATLTSVR